MPDGSRRSLDPLEPDWYVFPFCNRVRPTDPTRSVTTIKSSWESVRDDAGIKGRFHDLRHTAYTKMVEDLVAEGIIMALMGHVSRAMVGAVLTCAHGRDAEGSRVADAAKNEVS